MDDSRHVEGCSQAEFASEMDVTPGAIRAAIRRGKLPGVMLRSRGKVYAYAATVDDVAAYYDLPPDVVDVPAKSHGKRRPKGDSLGLERPYSTNRARWKS